MNDPPNKIVIRPQDLASPKPPSMPAAPALQSATPAHGTKAPGSGLPVAVWIVMTFVPFLNAWIWWRHGPPSARGFFRVVAFLLAGLSCAGCIALGLAWLTKEPERDWVEQIAARANRSVVRLECDQSALGTGFVIASSGDLHLILTNLHVVADADDCQVVIRAGYRVPGEIVGRTKDDELDLALVRVDAPGLQTLGPLGRFSDVRVGEPVVAVGHPMGLDFTVTNGIVSAKRRGMELQTSAAISRGNSGGPLVNQDGFVVGVNTKVFDPSLAQSLGFAVRADLVFDREKWVYFQDVSDLLARVQR